MNQAKQNKSLPFWNLNANRGPYPWEYGYFSRFYYVVREGRKVVNDGQVNTHLVFKAF